MNKTLKKTLSIILTILMIASTVPFAFAEDCVHDYSGEHTCLGYYCPACESYYGEPGPHWWISDQCMICLEFHEHTGDAGTICMGTLCEICYYPYGEVTDPDAHDWNSSGTCGYCGDECEHPSYTDGVCDECDKKCSHEGQNGSCKNCGENLGKLVIDVTDKSSVNIGNGYDYYDEDGYIITGTNQNASVFVREESNLIFSNLTLGELNFNNAPEDSAINITLDGTTEVVERVFLLKEHLIFDGGETDIFKVPYFTTLGNSGSVTVNGGNIILDVVTEGSGSTIDCTGGFIINGGTVTASNNYFYVLGNSVTLNCGELNIINTAADRVAVLSDITMDKGALLTVSTTGGILYRNANILKADGLAESDYFFARYDTESEFVPVYDIIAALDGKTYAEIKIDTHEHSFENGKCVCGYDCPHEGQNGSCENCGINLGKLVIDVTDESYVYIGKGETYYDEDGYILTGNNEEAILYLLESSDFVFDSLTAYHIVDYTSDDTINVTIKGNNNFKEHFSPAEGDIVLDAEEGAMLKAACSSTSGMDGTFTVNGGDITFASEGSEYCSSIDCGDFIINGGSVTASNNNYCVINSSVKLNSGTLNVICTSESEGAINNDITMNKGALLTVSATNGILDSYGNILKADGLTESDYFFVRYDTESEFVPVSDIRAALDGKTYAEIKIYTHEHSFENGKCVCSYECSHSFTKYEEVTAPECGKAGLEMATCDHGCGETDENEIPALEHEPLDAVVENEVAPKCGIAGSYDLVVYCDLCGEELDRDTVVVDALTHKDDDSNYLCDHGCGHEFEKPVDPTPDVPDIPDEPTDDTCDHLCHKDGILGFFWKIISFLQRLFGIQQYCDCGELHYNAPIFG